MGQLPEFHDSDDDELIALGGALDHPNTKDERQDGDVNSDNIQDEAEFFKQLKGAEIDQDDNGYYDPAAVDGLSGLEGADEDFSDDEMGIVGGHATNLDGLDKDQIMKMIDQEVDGLDFDQDGEQVVDLDGVELELEDAQLDDDDDEIGDQEIFN